MPKLSVHIVTWNSLVYLQACFQALADQTEQDFSILVVDNGSTDGSVQFVRDNCPQAKILQNRQNLGFSRAHNQAIRISSAPFVLVLNPDVILTPSYLERALVAMDRDPQIGSVSGKLLKFVFSSDEMKEPKRTDIIDSTGLQVLRSRRTFNRGEGESDRSQYDSQVDIFGVSGAVALYRRSALDDVTMGDEIFDNQFFSYKEDVDLAWRLQRLGWRAAYAPDALAYHHRGVSGDTRSDARVIRQRKHHSRFVNGFSYSNHLCLLVKNEVFGTFIRDWPWIIFYELKKFLFLLLFEPITLGSVRRFLRYFPSMRRKHAIIVSRTRVAPNDIRKKYFLAHG